ncbi:MAG: glutathione S-transferase N-terminal domain-containing protein [Deltaproteobacteria bacterium]|nr:glutathione S-transferase N-terminal domain-containing protein [Deltaproteobacteria bacterium]
MRLYDFPLAPNPRRTRIYLAEKGLSIPLVLVNLREGAQRTPEFLAKNPHGSLPVLELDDGTLLSESEAIIEYLEELASHCATRCAYFATTRTGSRRTASARAWW